MDTITRNVNDLSSPERQAMEHILGQPLFANQQLVIAIVTLPVPATSTERFVDQAAGGEPTLPAWCDVYAGLSDEEIAELEQVILQRAELH